MTRRSNVEALLTRVNRAIADAERHRGDARSLVKAAPLEIHLYNLATGYISQLKSYQALLEDASGTYMRDVQ
jgi:hypothetical protein